MLPEGLLELNPVTVSVTEKGDGYLGFPKMLMQPLHPALVLISRPRFHKCLDFLQQMFLEVFLQKLILNPGQSSC